MPDFPRPELLAPAGDMEKLQSALHFGADAVYLAGESLGLRKAARNFTREEMTQAVEYAHARGAKVHVTMNVVPHPDDFEGLEEYARFLERIGVDAVIISDPGVFSIVRGSTRLPIHISTQASVTNAQTVNFWARLGAERVVLARELSLEEIRQIRKDADPAIELEAFVHGAMCISVSGRCLLSAYMTGRDANRGDCAQACRWKYRLEEETRPGEYFPITEDARGTYIMNSKDLCLLPHIRELAEAGIVSFKIEGRVKTAYYVSTIVQAYRRAIDAMMQDALTPALTDSLLEEIRKTSHRPFTTAFLYGEPGQEAQNYESTSYIRNYDFVGVVRGVDAARQTMQVEVRNKFTVGESIEILRAKEPDLSFVLQEIRDAEGTSVESALVPRSLVTIPLPGNVSIGDMLRRKKESE